MNAEAILIRIEEDAKQTAERLENEAKIRSEELKIASREKIEAMHSAMLMQAEKDSAELEQRLLRMAELDDRKAFLKRKRDMMDQAFELAYEKMLAAPALEKRAFFLRQTVRLASGQETLAIGDVAADWLDGSFLTEANQTLLHAGKPGNLKLSQERVPGCAGVVLQGSGSETRCTFEAFLEELRPELEQKVASELFQTVES